MDPLKLFTVLALHVGTQIKAQKEGCSTSYLSFSTSYDLVLENVALERFTVSSVDWCQIHCTTNPRCRSFNFQMRTGLNDTAHQCEVNFSTKTKCPECLNQRAGWVYREDKRADSLPILVSKANVAQGKPTMQSSTANNAPSSLAVDGDTDENMDNSSCSQTRTSETNPWWRVDLGSCYSITKVTVYSRRVVNMEIRIGNSLSNNGNNNAAVATGETFDNLLSSSYTFPPLLGRFVNVRLVGSSLTLALCEVQVFGIHSVCPVN